ncbi:MAG: metallophosphoesterase [Melioribacteraceae bacterium]|nr:metallophosphoesterase [Melioribacteraceae bacterium]
MKPLQMIIFFSIVFSIYGTINYYIIRRGLTVIPNEYKSLYLIIIIFLAASYIAGRLLENIWVSPLSVALVYIGSFWLAIMIYIFLQLLIVDFVLLIEKFFHFIPSFLTKDIVSTKKIVALSIVILTIIIVAAGYINTNMIIIKKYNINVKKNAGELKSLNIAMASDLHLGTINSYGFMYEVAEKINSLNPDIILFAGDIIDEDLAPVIKYDVGEHLNKLKSKYGVYGITGNHEYIGGVEPAVKYLEKYNIKIIRDDAIKIDNAFYLVGREDLSIKQFAGKRRKELSEIIKDIDKSLPIILMDHQPYKLEEAQKNKIDLQLSGHTHNGQLWPFNYIVEKIYELAWGYRVIDNTHYYVSCGVGGWGPPIRTGSRPEIINIKLNFIGDEKSN